MRTNITKYPFQLKADPRRVVALPSIYPGLDRVKRIYDRIHNLEEENAQSLYDTTFEDFGDRHKNLPQTFRQHYQFFKEEYSVFPALSELKQQLLGAMLTKEYSIQSAALFNPSIVPHPDQGGLLPGQLRFVMSLRSVGEGHISSIEFRSGILSPDGAFELEPASRFSLRGTISETFNETDYRLVFPDDSELSERVLFPQTETESMGMEDLRLVAFRDGEETVYYGTYTAYNGRQIRSQVLQTTDFKTFIIKTLKGKSAQDKGMAIFPEKIDGRYGIVSRQGGENISIMFSDDLFYWPQHDLLMEPKFPFEYSQIGNCGSPIMTEAGWLLLTHGVGPMRHYTISAALLDLQDPSKVIARLDRPLIWPAGDEREGYVPNVVYTCGGLILDDMLFIPYAMSDSKIGFCRLETDDLLDELKRLA